MADILRVKSDFDSCVCALVETAMKAGLSADDVIEVLMTCSKLARVAEASRALSPREPA